MEEVPKTSLAYPDEHAGPVRQLADFVRLYWRFAKYTFPYWDKLLLLVLMAQAVGLMWVLSAMATARVVDEGLREADGTATILWCAVWFTVMFLTYVVYNLQTIMSAYIKMRVDYTLKMEIFNHLQKLSLSFQQSRPIGENMFRLNNDTMVAANVAAAVIPDTLTKIVTIATTGTLLFAVSPWIAGSVFLYMLLYVIFAHIVTTFSTRFENQKRKTGQATQAMFQENLSAYVISKAMAREQHERRRYFSRVADLARATYKYGVAHGLCMEGLRGMWNWYLNLAQALFCGYLVIQGVLTIGEYVAVGQILFQVIGPLSILVWMIIWFRVAAVTLRRLCETLDVEPGIVDKGDAVPLVDPRGEIVFDNVKFRYTEDGEDVIKGLSFTVPPGGKTAIVGASGAGKTTIFNLIMRFYQPSEGRVLIDGHDLNDLEIETYHDNLSIVLQDNFMYSTTVRENILFGQPEATEEELDRAIELAGLRDLIDRLPRGLDTILKEGGDLSAGQLQRIGMARAVIRNPRFLYLDEATSSLDPVTEAEVLHQLKKIEKGRTRLVIAHNIVSVKDADEILVMEHGNLIQRGTHEQLLQEEGIYQKMWAAELEKMNRPDALAGA